MSEPIIAADPAAAADRAADVLMGILGSRPGGSAAHVALAGGTTPRAVYALLAERVGNWDDVHLWLGDERVVARDDPDANQRMVRESLLAPAGFPEERFHAPPTELGGDAACAAYAAALAELLPHSADGTPVFDIAVLGLGEDAHTASLFPDAAELAITDRPCALVRDAPKPPPERVTLTLPVLAAARRRIILATGSGKAMAVAAAVGRPRPHAPASLLPRSGTTWILDRDAAALIAHPAADG